jgi:RNA polymerase sigma-70 factor (ECF subfamily)
MDSNDQTGEFVRLLTLSQRPLYAFIRAQVYSRTDADDLHQQTTAILWEKFESFDRAQSFLRWACGVAWREVLLHRRNSRRRTFLIGPELGELLVEKLASAAAQVDQRLDKLQECLAALKPQSRRLIERRYYKEEDVRQIAARSGLSESSVYKTLTKIRQILLDCIEQKLKEEG